MINSSKCLYIDSYTHLITSSALTSVLVHYTAARQNVTDNTPWTQKSIEVGLYNMCHKINIRGPLGDILFYVILTISYLRYEREFVLAYMCTDCIFQL